MAMMDVGFAAAFLGGLLSFFSPCVIPLIPIYISYLSGAKVSEMGNADAALRARIFANAVAFVLGFSLVFIALGILVGLLSQGVPDFRIWLGRVGGVIIILLGLQTLGLLTLPFLSEEKRAGTKPGKAGYLNSVMIGGAFAVGWTPCVSGILAGILVIAGAIGSAFDGALLLAVYSAGFAIPFLLTGLFTSQIAGWIRKSGPVFSAVNAISGVLLIALGILVFTDNFQVFLSRII